ncbi:uncharacterized protein T551_01158 [Pneumocystis jirovecii RU7]|uniref:Uncharacterized protein n=1 Tax=Pneumocystis jirovecii (strain RU7) TaxID=1408657 RepID=A0A0W4ZU51_PNEJ7|nr:uncharacterized protein T551_01158 [Pneumocystis jirovecii RU7]KTW31897.1 hypothetical protein T551_01158 [Pneumocystis jirovecii RU7]
MADLHQNEKNSGEKPTGLQELRNQQIDNKAPVKSTKKETVRRPLYDPEKNNASKTSQGDSKTANANIKKTISVFEQMSFTKITNKNVEDRNKRVRASVCLPISPAQETKKASSPSSEKRINITKKKAYSPTNEAKTQLKENKEENNTKMHVTKEILFSCASLQKNVLDKSSAKLSTKKSIATPSSVEKKENIEKDAFVKTSNDSNNKLLDEKLFESQGDENNASNVNDSSSIYGNSLDSDLVYEVNDLKDQLAVMMEEKLDIEMIFNEKYSKLEEKNNELEEKSNKLEKKNGELENKNNELKEKNQDQEKIINILNKQIESLKLLISDPKDNVKYIEKIEFLSQKIEKLEFDLNELNMHNQILLKELDANKIENQKSTKVLENEIEKSKNIIKDLEGKLKVDNTNIVDSDEYLQSIKLDYIKKEEILRDKLIHVEQVMEIEKAKSTEDIQKMKEEIKISNSLRKKMGIDLSNALTKNSNLSQELDIFKNSLETIRNNYEKALEKEFKEKNDIYSENFQYIRKINSRLEALTDELENEKRKLHNKTVEYDKLYFEFSDLKSKYTDFQEKVFIKDQQTMKHISKIKEEHELMLKSLLKEHNMIIEKLNIQEDILSKYIDIIKEKDEIIKQCKQNPKNIHSDCLETNDILDKVKNKDMLITN